MLHKLCDEAERLLDGDTANECDHMRIVALSDLLHRVNLTEKVSPLTSCGTGCREGERGGEGEREREGGRKRERGRGREREKGREGGREGGRGRERERDRSTSRATK